MTINRLDKLKNRPAPRRSCGEHPRSPRVSNEANKTVTRRLMEVIRCTPVRNEA
jgi:hypothetical protein